MCVKHVIGREKENDRYPLKTVPPDLYRHAEASPVEGYRGVQSFLCSLWFYEQGHEISLCLPELFTLQNSSLSGLQN